MKKIDWNALAQKAHQAAVDKCFYDEGHNFIRQIMLIVTEISEIVEADRRGWRADIHKYLKNGEESFRRYIKNSVEDEMADTAIRLLAFSRREFVNLTKIDKKVSRFNNSRALIDIPSFCYQMCCTLTASSWSYRKRAIIHTLAFLISRAELMNIDLLWFIEEKMKYNEGRPPKHNKKY